MKSYTAKEIAAILVAHGFEHIRTKGSHNGQNDNSADAWKGSEKGHITWYP